MIQPPSSVPHEPQGDETTGVTSGRSATSSAVTGVRHTSQGNSKSSYDTYICEFDTVGDLCHRCQLVLAYVSYNGTLCDIK